MTWIPQWIPRKNATLFDWPHCWDCLAKGLLEHLFFSFWENSTIRPFKIICYYPKSFLAIISKSFFLFVCFVCMCVCRCVIVPSYISSVPFFLFRWTEKIGFIKTMKGIVNSRLIPVLWRINERLATVHPCEDLRFWLQNIGHQFWCPSKWPMDLFQKSLCLAHSPEMNLRKPCTPSGNNFVFLRKQMSSINCDHCF